MTVLSGLSDGTAWMSTDLEEAEIPQALLGAAQLGGREGVAFRQPELAADHLVLGADVAGDVDALDIDLRAFLDVVGQVEDLVLGVAVDARPHVDEGVAEAADVVG